MTEKEKQLVINNMRLVYYSIKKYNYDEDYASIGTIGLIKGVKTFNPDKGYKLSTYLVKCINNEIAYQYRKNKKNPSNCLSMDTLYIKDNITLSETIEDKTVDIEKDLVEKEKKIRLKKAISKLNDEEKRLIMSLYGLYGYEKKKQTDLVKEFKCTQSNISRKHKKILNKLKQIMESDETYV